MKNLVTRWNEISLVKRIICGLIIGIVLGLVVPQATALSLLGNLFVGALKAIAPILVLFWSCPRWQSIRRASRPT